ncbi:hypothetical protein HLK59_03355 [Streptomyces sp. S3(2020)]|uniref:hypothetical protein n=1 Tax=Streptomyces sp. S3(2020) TaxID=2732044 RepID=UPI0014884E60|nr:hypothetical protein [Streptomyces sp. S3(2020)]NNN29405.1 hypothetical protein [Streptomyces sp. S3(2020)]
MAEWRPVLASAAGVLLLAGCTSGSGDEPKARSTPEKSPGASASPSGSASASPVNEPYSLAENRAPRTRTEAVEFVRELTVRPDYFGTGYRKRDPFESDPAEWAVLGDDCLWRREALPDTVLASLTRAFELPAKDGKGPVYVSLTVTVHQNVLAARRDMAGSLEEPLRCPEQRLNATDRVRGLYSRVDAFADERSVISEDDLTETGDWVADGGKAYPFDWSKFRLGPVTVAATARHGSGRSEAEDSTITTDMAKGLSFIAADIDQQGKAGDAGDTGDAGDAGATAEPTGTKEAEQ